MNSPALLESHRQLWVRRGLPVLMAALTALASPVAAEVEVANWNRFDSASFTLLSNADTERSAAVLVDLERFRSSFVQLAPAIDSGGSVPTHIVAFRDADSYEPFKSGRDGGGARILGQFLGHRDGNFITLNVDPSGGGGLGIIIHEYVHHVVNQNLPGVPRWLNEGLAEYYSSFEVQGEYAVVGGPVERHLGWWRRNHELSIADVLSESRGTPIHSLGGAGQFYAVSWGLTHYLMSSPAGAEVLAAYLEDVALGGDRSDSLLSGLDLSARNLEEELRSHVLAERLPVARLSLEEMGAIEVDHARAPADYTLTVLGDLASRLGNENQAEEFFDLALGYNPDNAEALSGLAWLRDAQGRLEEAGVLFAAALAAGPKSARTHLRHGRHLLRRVEFERAAPEAQVEQLVVNAKSSFLAAAALEPSFAEVYAMLAVVHLFEGLDAAEGLVFSERAAELLPTRPDVIHMMIRLLLKQGETSRAREVLDGSFRLLAERDAQVRVEDEIQRAELLLAAQEALSARKWDEGLELFDRAISFTEDADMRAQMEEQLERLEIQAELERRQSGQLR